VRSAASEENLYCRRRTASALGLEVNDKMEIGKMYDVVFSTGRYEIEYENSVRCIKKTPKSYRVERLDGTTRLVGQDSIMELKEVAGAAAQ